MPPYQGTIVVTAKELLVKAMEKDFIIPDPSNPTTKLGDEFIKLVEKVRDAYLLAQG